jgi:hypothetical protein
MTSQGLNFHCLICLCYSYNAFLITMSLYPFNFKDQYILIACQLRHRTSHYSFNSCGCSTKYLYNLCGTVLAPIFLTVQPLSYYRIWFVEFYVRDCIPKSFLVSHYEGGKKYCRRCEIYFFHHGKFCPYYGMS